MSNFFTKKGGKERFIASRTLDYGTRRQYLLQIVDHSTKTYAYVRPGESFKVMPNHVKTFIRKALRNLKQKIRILTVQFGIIAPYVFLELENLTKLYFNFMTYAGNRVLWIDLETGSVSIA